MCFTIRDGLENITLYVSINLGQIAFFALLIKGGFPYFLGSFLLASAFFLLSV